MSQCLATPRVTIQPANESKNTKNNLKIYSFQIKLSSEIQTNQSSKCVSRLHSGKQFGQMNIYASLKFLNG